MAEVSETYRQRPSLFMSSVFVAFVVSFHVEYKLRFVSLSSSAHRSSDIFFRATVDVLVQGRETGFAARCVLLEICCGSSGEGGTHEVRG